MLARFAAATVLAMMLLGLCRADEISDRADRAIKAGDFDNNGKWEWKEAFERWYNFHTTLKVVEGDEDYEERVKNAFPDLVPAMDFLLADANDDLVVTRKELIDFFKLDAASKRPEPTRKKLETFSAAYVAAQWDTLCKLLDSDKDGKFSRAELDEHYPTTVNDECFKAADKNKDGKLDKAEYALFKVEEFQRGIYVDFDERGGEVGGAGGTGAEAGEKDPDDEKPADEKKTAEGKRPDESKKTGVKDAPKSRLRVGSKWLVRYRVEYKAKDGSGEDKWSYRLETVTAIYQKQGQTYVDIEHCDADEEGNATAIASGLGSRVTYTGPNAKYMPARKDMVKLEIGGETWECSVHELKDYTLPGGRGKGTGKFWQTYIDGYPFIVKTECDGIVTMELVWFKE